MYLYSERTRCFYIRAKWPTRLSDRLVCGARDTTRDTDTTLLRSSMPPFHEPTSVIHGIKERIESLCVHGNI